MRWCALAIGVCLVAIDARAEVLRREPPAGARDPDAARRSFEQATERARLGAYERAFEAAERAFAQEPSGRHAALVGAIAVELARGREALANLAYALDVDPTPERDAYVLEAVARAPPLAPVDHGLVRFDAIPAGMRCHLTGLDGVVLELDAGRRTFGLPVGRHALRCEAGEGFVPVEVTFDVTPRRLAEVFIVAREPVTAVEPEPWDGDFVAREWSRPPPSEPTSPLPWALCIGGGVALGLGAVAHVMAFDAADDAESAVDSLSAGVERSVAHERYRTARERMELTQELAIVAYVIGGVALTSGIVLLSGGADEPALAPVIGRDHGGLSWSATF